MNEKDHKKTKIKLLMKDHLYHHKKKLKDLSLQKIAYEIGRLKEFSKMYGI